MHVCVRVIASREIDDRIERKREREKDRSLLREVRFFHVSSELHRSLSRGNSRCQLRDLISFIFVHTAVRGRFSFRSYCVARLSRRGFIVQSPLCAISMRQINVRRNAPRRHHGSPPSSPPPLSSSSSSSPPLPPPSLPSPSPSSSSSIACNRFGATGRHAKALSGKNLSSEPA